MTPKLLTFMRLLREHGVRLSVAESLDALHSVSRIGLQDRELLRLALRTALIKSQADFATFDTLFERFFSLPRRKRRRRVRQRNTSHEGLGQRANPQSNGQPLRPTQPQSQPAQPPAIPHPAPEPPSPDAQEPSQSQEIKALIDLEHAWNQQLQKPLPSDVPHTTQTDGNRANTRIDREFPPDQLAALYREVERLVAPLLTRRALRYRRARRGQFDLRRTVLRSLRGGSEVPFALSYRRRPLGKLRLVVLCDVSGSVWHVSTFLLKLVHTLQAEFTQVRSLLFVSSIVEVTSLFRHMRFPDDFDTLRHYPNLNLFGYSDFGRAFYQFYRDLLGDLTRDTVLVILGDARNNAFDPQEWTLEEIRQRCRRLIWLNPEPRQEWNQDDSVMEVYAPFCDAVLECWTMEHLVQAADVLLQV
ncbi:MAG: VWA domain-containing protein [Candidatus Tectomicrobia bacterium]|nr:VWA domain-containing protein [Candidatus Tectomicrobia bacterium]